MPKVENKIKKYSKDGLLDFMYELQFRNYKDIAHEIKGYTLYLTQDSFGEFSFVYLKKTKNGYNFADLVLSDGILHLQELGKFYGKIVATLSEIIEYLETKGKKEA